MLGGSGSSGTHLHSWHLRGRGKRISKFEIILVYKMTAKVTQRKPVSTKQTNKTKRKRQKWNEKKRKKEFSQIAKTHACFFCIWFEQILEYFLIDGYSLLKNSLQLSIEKQLFSFNCILSFFVSPALDEVFSFSPCLHPFLFFSTGLLT